MHCANLHRCCWSKICVLYALVIILCIVGDMASKRHGASRKYKLHHHHYHHHNHHHSKQYHHFNHPMYIENESDTKVESRTGNFKQTHQSGVQNSLDFPQAHNEYSGISNRADQVLRSWESKLHAKSRSVTKMNGEDDDLGNVVSDEHVGNAATSILPYDILAQTQNDNPTSPLQYSIKNNILYDKKYTDETPNHVESFYHSVLAKQKSKQFFVDAPKGVPFGDLATARSSSDSRRITSDSSENRSGLSWDLLHDNVVAEDGIYHTKYHDNEHIHSVDESTVSYNARSKLSESTYHNTLNKDTRNQTGSLRKADSNTTHLHGYHHDRNSIQYENSSSFQSRSLIESPNELEEVHWPVKKEAVVEGDLVLGGLMMVHEREDTNTCGPVMPQGGIQALETMLYTLDELNKEPKMIPNVVIGAHILDDCDKDTYGLEMAVDFIKGRKRKIGYCNFFTLPGLSVVFF